MDEAARCDRIAMMQQGEIMVNDTPDKILSEFSKPLFEVKSNDRFSLLQALRSMQEVKSAYLFGRSVHVTMESEKTGLEWLLTRLESLALTSIEISTISADFEDCFIEAVENNHANSNPHE
jgi:ABC-type multidrug transport system ATPase subunit